MRYLLYVSRATFRQYDISDLDILRKAIDFNKTHGISGFLMREDGLFVQYIEGEDAAMKMVMGRIKRDVRHSDIRVVEENPVYKRAFDGWSMGYSFGAGERLAEALGKKRLQMNDVSSGGDVVPYLLKRANAQRQKLAANTEASTEDLMAC